MSQFKICKKRSSENSSTFFHLIWRLKFREVERAIEIVIPKQHRGIDNLANI